MAEKASIQNIINELRAHAEASGDAGLLEQLRKLEESLPKAAGSITVGNISGSDAIAIGSDIQITLHKTSNIPDDLLARLMALTDNLNQRADATAPSSGHIRIFLASPGDVKDERKLARKAISKIAADPYYKNLNIEEVAWDKPEDSTPMLAGIDPQRAISEGLARPADCDICVVVFWSRMGTPLDHTQYKKVDGSQYLSGTEWELENALESFGKSGLPLTMVYRRTEKVVVDLDAPDFQEKARQRGLVREFLGTRNLDGSIRLNLNEYESPSEFGDMVELHLRKLIAQVVEKKRPAVKTSPEKTVPAPTWPKDKSPFPGLRAFGPQDAPIFFGRGMETDLLLRRLSDPNCRFLAVVGASGSGKSSLVGAGLLPRIQEGALPGSEDWLVATFTPDALGDGNPFNALTWALSQPPFKFEARETDARLREKPSALRELIEAYLDQGPDWKRAVLFIDQFEELFTRVLDESLRREFSILLSEAANSPRILTVVTMRDDFYHYCVKSPVLSRLINRNTDSTFTLSAPGQLELYEMINGPARVAGLQFENGLVRRILEDTGSNPGALALMAYALDQLHKASGDDDKMNFAEYNSFGGVQGAIGARAQGTFDRLSEAAQKTLPRVFRELLEVDESGTATRKRAPLERVERDEASRELVVALVQARLLVTSRSADNQALVEVAHEALFRSWPELAKWIAEAQEDLILLRQVRTAADWWDKHERRSEFLWPDERLQPVYAMRERLSPDLNETEQEFIRHEAERLLQEIENSATTHQRRSDIGARLNEIGDPRAGVGLVSDILPLHAEGEVYTFNSLRAGELRLWGDKSEHAGLPDLVWLSVDGGSIQIEKQMFKVEPFYIAKYPITYMQFQSFLDAEDGFKDSRWWKGLSADKDHKSQPGEQNFKFHNHPRENVSWYDSIAFCRWLNARMRWAELPADLSSKTLGAFKGVRLPAEWEWQWAATGGKTKYEYPWGDEWDGNKANTSESRLSRTTAVGMYPAGSAKCGALDLSGNVWELCFNEHEKPENVGLNGENHRVVRGGSWYRSQDLARASSRGYYFPGYRSYAYGFRVVVRPPSL